MTPSSPIPAHQSYRKSHGIPGGKYLRPFIEESDSAGRHQAPRGLTQDVSARIVKSTDSPAGGPLRPAMGHRSVPRGRRPRRLKGSVSTDQGLKLGEMSSVQALMELALPRFTMVEGPRVKHLPWPVASEAPASPSPNQIELRREDPRYSSKQPSFQSVHFGLDALASSSDEESVDVKKCKDLLVTVLYKSEEADTLARSEMVVSDSACQAVPGVRDVRKVVQTTKPARPDSPLEISGPSNRTVQTREGIENSFSFPSHDRHDSCVYSGTGACAAGGGCS